MFVLMVWQLTLIKAFDSPLMKLIQLNFYFSNLTLKMNLTRNNQQQVVHEHISLEHYTHLLIFGTKRRYLQCLTKGETHHYTKWKKGTRQKKVTGKWLRKKSSEMRPKGLARDHKSIINFPQNSSEKKVEGGRPACSGSCQVWRVIAVVPWTMQSFIGKVVISH